MGRDRAVRVTDDEVATPERAVGDAHHQDRGRRADERERERVHRLPPGLARQPRDVALALGRASDHRERALVVGLPACGPGHAASIARTAYGDFQITRRSRSNSTSDDASRSWTCPVFVSRMLTW